MNKNDQPILLSVISIALIAFLGILAETALNIAYAVLMPELSVSAAIIQWLTTGYLLTLSSLIPLSPLLIRKFCTRRLFQSAVWISFSGTLLCGLSQNFPLLLTGRIIQAIGTSIALPLMVTLILEKIPANRRGKVMGIVGLVTSFAPALGPVFGGIIMEYGNWHWIFFLMLPFLLISFIIGSRNIPDIHKNEPARTDFLSMLLSTTAFVGIVYGVSSSAAAGWTDAMVLTCLAVGSICLLLFIRRQLSLEKPLLELRVFRFPMFTIGVFIVILSMLLVLSASFILPLYLQNSLGCTSFFAAIAMLPGALVNGIMSPLTGRWLDVKGPKGLLRTGSFLVAAMTAIFAFVPVSFFELLLVYAIFMFGASMLAMPAQTNGLNQLPAKYNADGSAVINTLQQVSGAIGTALASSIFSSAKNSFEAIGGSSVSASTLYGTQTTFTALFIFALACAFISLFARR